MKKKGQIPSVLAFVAIAITLFLLAPFLLKIFMSPVAQFGNSLNQTDSNAGGEVNWAVNKFVSFWDTVIVIAFFANVVILLVSSFMIDIHPIFVVFYIIGLIVLFMFAPNFLKITQTTYNQTALSTEVSQIPYTNWLQQNFGVILLGIAFISGVVVFAKIKYFPANQGGSY